MCVGNGDCEDESSIENSNEVVVGVVVREHRCRCGREGGREGEGERGGERGREGGREREREGRGKHKPQELLTTNICCVWSVLTVDGKLSNGGRCSSLSIHQTLVPHTIVLGPIIIQLCVSNAQLAGTRTGGDLNSGGPSKRLVLPHTEPGDGGGGCAGDSTGESGRLSCCDGSVAGVGDNLNRNWREMRGGGR